ncbi:sorting nexin-25-like [Protopterus annectens]|uniref:sorting nexin-25-like n=1 Tax=Protopterus annectens TaxID=7888 RepID=UPI001CFBA906|nr:sorting nexin-25-like [Protopterus annectens]
MFQNKVDQLFTESSFASYINFLQQILWPGGKPAASSPPRTEEEKIETKKKAEELLLKRIPTAVLKILFKNPKSKIRFVLSVFQDNEANKRLIYMLLFFLLGEIIPELKTTLKSEHIPWLKNIVE